MLYDEIYRSNMVLFAEYAIFLCAVCRRSNAQQYQDSILKIAHAMPNTLVRLTYLRDMAYRHQYPPYNKTFSTALYEEARAQKNVTYENLGAILSSFLAMINYMIRTA